MSRKKVLACLLTGAMVCSLIGCGGSYRSSDNPNNTFSFEASLSTKDENEAGADTGTGSVVEDSHVNTGEVVYSYDGSVSSWHLYDYDESGNLICDKLYDAVYGGYLESIFDANGLKLSAIQYDDSGMQIYGTTYEYDANGNLIKEVRNDDFGSSETQYTYECDENGRIFVKMQTNAGEAQPAAIFRYSYDESGNMEAEEQLSPDGMLYGKKVYDDNGNEIASYSYDYEGNVIGYTYQEFDENGDLVQIRYANMMEPDEITINYINSYDDAGNLISISGYNSAGMLIQKNLNAYAEASADYGQEEILAQAEATESRFYKMSTKEEEHFALIKEKILNDETVFTFGYYSSQFMQVESINMVEFSWDEQGRYCKVDVNYSSDYGDYYLGGNVYYVIDGTGRMQLTQCKLNSWGDLEMYDKMIKAQAPQEYLYVYFNSYFPTTVTTNGIEKDKNQYYSFSGKPEEFVGGVNIKSSMNPELALRSGEFTAEACMEENVDAGINFVLKICWENGLVEKYYCASIYDQYAFQLFDYDENSWEILSEQLYVIENEPSYVQEILQKRAEWAN